jgi:hypothetical protein
MRYKFSVQEMRNVALSNIFTKFQQLQTYVSRLIEKYEECGQITFYSDEENACSHEDKYVAGASPHAQEDRNYGHPAPTQDFISN